MSGREHHRAGIILMIIDYKPIRLREGNINPRGLIKSYLGDERLLSFPVHLQIWRQNIAVGSVAIGKYQNKVFVMAKNQRQGNGRRNFMFSYNQMLKCYDCCINEWNFSYYFKKDIS